MFLFSLQPTPKQRSPCTGPLPELYPPSSLLPKTVHSPDTHQPTVPDLRTSRSRMDLNHGEKLKLYSPGEAQTACPVSREPFCSSEGQGSSIITSAQEKGRVKGSRTPPRDSGTNQVPSSLTGSGHMLWSLSPLSAQLVSSPPHYGP